MLAERRVTARTVKRQLVQGQIREVCSPAERLVGFISPRQDRWSAYIHSGCGYLGLGLFDTREDALEAISKRFNPALARRVVHKA
jgi:hypothetical protein